MTGRDNHRLAQGLTDALAPGNLVIAGLPLVGLAAPNPGTGFLWGCLAALFAGVIPLAVIILGVRRGRITDVHVSRREQRTTPLLIAIGSVVAGVVLMYLLPAPDEVRVLIVAMLAGLMTAAAITRVWKISIHTAVATGFVVVFVATFGTIGWLVALPAAAVSWSRLQLGAHTHAQVAAGALLGAVVTGGLYLLMYYP